MLSELSGLQESSEDVWGCAEVSFTINTREEDEDEIIEREYTFSHAPEWDKWTFVEFEERRANDAKYLTNRTWRRTKHVMWDDAESPTVSVPPEVQEKLEEMLGLEQMVIQQ